MAYDFLITITAVFVLSTFLSEIAGKLKVSRVIAQILAGILLGIPLVRAFVSKDISIVSFLADIGIVFMLFLIGLETNFAKMKKTSKEAVLVSFFSAAVPIILGYIVMRFMLNYSNTVSIVTAMALAVTAEGVILAVLSESKKMNTRLGRIILEAGIMDDLFEFIFISIVLILAHKGSGAALIQFPFKILLFTGIAYLLFKLIIPWITKHLIKNNNRVEAFSIILGMGLIVASISTFLDLGPIIGAFLAGVIIKLVNEKKDAEKIIVEELKVITFGFIMPFFFVYVGFNFDISSVFTNPYILLLITLAAISGKVFGSMMVGFFDELSFKKLSLIGWSMNARGAMEIVIAQIAKNAGLIPVEVYSAIVGMAIITTIIFPFVLRSYLAKDKNIMD